MGWDLFLWSTGTGWKATRGFHPLVHWPCVHRLFSNTTGVLAALMAPVTQYLLLQKVYSFLSTFTGALLAYFFSSWVSLTFHHYFLLNYLCVTSCVCTLFSFTPYHLGRHLQVKGSCSVQEGAAGWEWRSWGKAALRPAKICHLRLLCSAATESRFSERNPSAEHQHFVPVPSLILLGSAVCAACLWKQSPATAPNIGPLKINTYVLS